MASWRFLCVAVALGVISQIAVARACDVPEGIARTQALLMTWRASGHPLAGEIFMRGKRLSPQDDVERLGACSGFRALHLLRAPDNPERPDIIVAGEVHDNPGHHLFRAHLVSAMPRGSTAVFEHIREDQIEALSRFRALAEKSAAGLLDLLDWDKSGWPARDMFEPLFAAVIANGMNIAAGHPARDSLRSAARRGLEALPDAEGIALGLDRQLPDARQSDLVQELEASHCGLLPKSAFGGMSFAQRYRDAWLARTALRAAAQSPRVIVLTGNGHARSDRGVGWYLARLAPDTRAVSVLLLEVEPDKADADGYGLTNADGSPVADYVIFTSKAQRGDPCLEMRRTFERKKN